MTRNYKPDELPERFDVQLSNNPDVAHLVADQRLARRDVTKRIEAALDIDLDGAARGHLTLKGLAQLYKEVSDDGRRVCRLKRDFRKGDLAARIVDAADADVQIDPNDDGDGFTKDELIRVWFAVYEPDIPDDDQPDQAQVEA